MGTRYCSLVALLFVALLLVPLSGTRATASKGDGAHPAPWFDTAGAHLDGTTLRLAAIGRGEDRATVTPSTPEDDGTHVQYRHGDVTEWYVRQGDGIEQGMTLATKPAGDSPLVLTIATPESVPVVDTDGLSATLLLPGAGGVSRWRYTGLRVTDATGAVVPGHLVATAGGMAIMVDDGEAAYPLTVDPYMLAQTLTDPGAASYDEFGGSVAVSGDASTLVVGADGTSTFHGAAYVYTKSGGSYGAPITLSDPGNTYNDLFGRSVRVSGDGSIVVVSASGEGGGVGAVFVYTKSGGSYGAPQTLANPGTTRFAYALAVSGGGSTVVVGAPDTISNQGRVYVYTQSGGSYSVAATLTDPITQRDDYFGSTVAVSGDGSTVVVGADYTTSPSLFYRGQAYVYTKSGGSYGTPITLTEPNAASYDYFGSAVAVSNDGSTLVVGASGVSSNQGRAYIYTKSGGSFGAAITLTDPGATNNDYFGGVRVSGDGSTVVVGASGTSSNQGRAYVYTKSGGGFPTTPTQTLTEPNAMSGDYFGAAAVSGDGATVLIGADGVSSHQGRAYVYGNVPIATNHRYEIAMNTPLVVAASSGLLSGSSLSAPSATISAHTNPAHGSVSINPDGSFTYIPTMGYSGADSFTYTLSNSAGMSTGTVTLTVLNGTIFPQPTPQRPPGTVGGSMPYSQPTGHTSGTVGGSTPLPQPARH